MNKLNETSSGERIHISIFGKRNSGKSSLINALTNQNLAIVSDVPGTTTDPVSKSMEILPLGPVVITDTAGIDDTGELGTMRVEKTLKVLENTDIAVVIIENGQIPDDFEEDLLKKIKDRNVPLIICATKTDIKADSSDIKKWASQHSALFVPVSAVSKIGIEQLKETLSTTSPTFTSEQSIVGDLISEGDIIVLVVPIDKSAPKGRLILPQVMTIRDILDNDAIAITVKERELSACLKSLNRKPRIVVTDSQAFLKVHADTPNDILMTSFSILMARYKGDLESFAKGAAAIDKLKTGDKVLIAEACTHHAQADDIGRVQIPRWLRQMVGGDLDFGFASGKDFPADFASYKLIVHCGGCMINRREMLYRQRVASEAGIPMTNYGVLLAKVHGILNRALTPFPLAKLAIEESDDSAHLRIERSF